MWMQHRDIARSQTAPDRKQRPSQTTPDRLIADSPSLTADLEDEIAHAYAHARDLAIAKTDLPETTLPATCPYAIATLRDPDVYLAPTDPESR